MKTLLVLLFLCCNAFATPSVKDFGAVGDGIHDDREAFQTAMDSTTGPLFVPNGLYLISQAPGTFWGLHPNKRLQLIGESSNETIIKQAPGAGHSAQLFWIEGIDNSSFTNVTLDGQALYQNDLNPQRHGIFAKHSSGLTLDNVVLENFTGDGIHVHDRSNDTAVRNSTFSNNRRNGFTLGGNTDRTTFINNNFVGNYAEQLDSEHGAANNVVVVRNTFDTLGHSNDFVLTVTGDVERSKNWTITDNIVNGSTLIMRVTDVIYARNTGNNDTGKPSVYIYRNTDRIRVEDNVLTVSKPNEMDGGGIIYVLGTNVNASPGGVIIERNVLTTSEKAHGISIICTRDIVVADNIFTGSGKIMRYESGVYVRTTRDLEPVNFVSILRNRFTNFGSNGVLIGGNGTAKILRFELIGNEFITTTGSMVVGMNLNDGYNELQDTFISNNTFIGIPTILIHPPAGILQVLDGQRWLQ